jgi:hypothetical protein
MHRRRDGVPCASGSILTDESPFGLIRAGRATDARCDRWNCPYCAPKKGKEIHRRLAKSLSLKWDEEVEFLRETGQPATLAWRPFKLLTLTFNARRFLSERFPSEDRYRAQDGYATPADAHAAWAKIAEAWNWLRTLMVEKLTRRMRRRRRFAKWELNRRGEPAVPFFWVVELTRKGWPHLHIIVLHRSSLNKQEISELWEQRGVGKVVDLRNRNRRWQDTRAVGLAFYLAKYLVKELPRPDHIAFRRWSSSHGFLIPRQRRRAHKAGFSSASVEVHRAERSDREPISSTPRRGSAGNKKEHSGPRTEFGSCVRRASPSMSASL